MDWATPIREFFETSIEPKDEYETKRIRRLTPSYIRIDEIIYKKGFSKPFFGRAATVETTSILRELDEGYIACDEGAR